MASFTLSSVIVVRWKVDDCLIVWLLDCLSGWRSRITQAITHSSIQAISQRNNNSVRRLPFRAEVTFYSAMDYVNFRHLTSMFQKCRIFVPNVPLCSFRTRCCVVLYFIVFRYVSLIFPLLKGKTMGKRSNNERINDDAWWLLQRLIWVERSHPLQELFSTL